MDDAITMALIVKIKTSWLPYGLMQVEKPLWQRTSMFGSQSVKALNFEIFYLLFLFFLHFHIYFRSQRWRQINIA